jgi:hypothetical protein
MRCTAKGLQRARAASEAKVGQPSRLLLAPPPPLPPPAVIVAAAAY